MYQQFKVSGGTPYYITCIDGRYYMAHHRTAQNIIAFDVTDHGDQQCGSHILAVIAPDKRQHDIQGQPIEKGIGITELCCNRSSDT